MNAGTTPVRNRSIRSVATVVVFILFGVLGLKLFGYDVIIVQHQSRAQTEYHDKTVIETKLTTGGFKNSSKPRLIVFPVFSLLTDPKQDLSHYGRRPTRAQLEARMTDFMESVQYSLDHPFVARVNLMYNQETLPSYVIKRLGNHSKLTFDRVESTYHVRKILKHIHNNFQNELILLTNGDVYPAQGLEHLDYDLMKRKKIFYGLSRHGKKEKRCTITRMTCDPNPKLTKSADSYIFIPVEPLSEDSEKVLKNLVWDFSAQEFILMHVYHCLLDYRVLNPCHVIFMYHNHCSRLRHSYRPKIGNHSIYYQPKPSTDLQ